KQVESVVGNIPIILSFPHGGNFVPDDVQVRKTGCHEPDFFTLELALILKELFPNDKCPYFVYGKVQRKFCDLNRGPESAFEDERMRPYYSLYHQEVRQFSKIIKNKNENCFLIDVHGQSEKNNLVLRGTSDGLTVKEIVERLGEDVVVGENSILGSLKNQGFPSYPEDYSEKEMKAFNGGWTVRHYHKQEGVNTLQIEIGFEFRKQENRQKFAEALRNAILQYLNHYC
ncbi:katG, partial [Acrasis kona]